MDVQKYLLAVAFTFVLSACGNQKTNSSVFPENGSMDSSACMGQAIANKFIVEWENGKFTVESAKDADEFSKTFITKHLQDIKYVEFDRQLVIENIQSSQYSYGTDSWGQDRINARALWAQGIYGQGVKVGVVDSFVDVNHPQLRQRIAVNTAEIPNNGRDDDGNGIIDDYYGATFVSNPSNSPIPSAHGTHVAGIIAADSKFGTVEGVAPQSQIIPAQFIANTGGGSLGDAILAMHYVASRGAKIINASWGGAPCVASLKNTFQTLERQGILVIVAAGNDGRDIDLYPEFPASFNLSNQITVAASTASDFMTAWSNSGFNLVHVAAPGDRILSTIPNNGTGYMDGTSMAAPMVSGAAALLWSSYPTASAVQIKNAILRSVDVTPGHEFKVNTRGRINVLKAHSLLKQLAP